MSDTTTTTAPAAPPTPAPPPAAPFPWFAYILLALVSACVVAAGLTLVFWSPGSDDPGTVNEVRITAKPGIDFRKLEEVLSTPDYYLELLTEQGAIRTRTFKNTRLGTGLTFKPPVPVPLSAITELRIWDEETISKDKQIDRVDRPAREVDGEKFHFSLSGYIPPHSNQWKVGLALAICGGAILLLTLLKFIRAQVL
jgi:hypothetical protein